MQNQSKFIRHDFSEFKLGKNIINFKRKYYIKDLYKPEMIIRNFYYTEFHDFKTFMYFINNDLFVPKDFVGIHVIDINKLKALKEIIINSDICELCNLYIFLKNDFKNFFSGLENKQFDCIFNNITIQINNNSFMKWRSRNRLFLEFNINKENHKTVFDDIISSYMEIIQYYKIILKYYYLVKSKRNQIKKAHN